MTQQHHTGLKKWVSIPYKRESIWEPFSASITAIAIKTCFDSLQTGKHMGTVRNFLDPRFVICLFRFPTNGKAYGNGTGTSPINQTVMFRFPTNGKAYGNSTPLQPSRYAGRYAQNQTRTARCIFLPKIYP